MKLRRWWHSLSFYWQLYLIMVLFVGAVVVAVEVILEPGLLGLLLTPEEAKLYHQQDQAGFTWIEILLWVVGVFTPPLVVGLFVMGMVRRKLESMLGATRRIAGGDFSARVPDFGSGRDAFSLLSRDFNLMADSLERSHRNEKRIMADISHELRSPLTRMGVAASILAGDRHADDFDSTMELLEKDLDHMNELVEILLIQGRNRSVGAGEIHPVAISEMAADMADRYNVLGRDARKRFVTDAAPGLFASGYDLRVRMVLENILSNALFYMPSDSVADIVVRERDDRIVVSVRDRGPGVPEGELTDIFRHFYRTDVSRTRDSGGVGLGLAIVKESVLEMGGQVEAVNADPGLEVRVSLPKI